jgi:GTP-binding protein
VHAFQHARFFCSAAQPKDLPAQAGPELVFAGRSNVGKSSALNALAGRRRLAFASKTPGRTRTINFFDLGGGRRLVDLPGYGYAAAPRAVRASWGPLISGFLASRRRFAAVVLLTDARRPLVASDREFLEWLAPVAGPRLVLLAKSDKLSRTARAGALAQARRMLEEAGASATTMLFSSVDGEGVPEARELLEAWLAQTKNPR